LLQYDITGGLSMIITELKELRKGSFIICIDGVDSFPLNIKDIEAAGIKEGDKLDENALAKLMEDYVWPKARQKALSLIKFQDRTQKELRNRLALEMYPEEIIERVIKYTIKYGFINDRRYADNYISSRKLKKSQTAIRGELLRKGINKELLDIVILSHYGDEEEEDPELIAIKKAVAKKVRDIDGMSHEEKEKLIASLYRKGFDLEKIKLIIGK
jgi:regulatory protein